MDVVNINAVIMYGGNGQIHGSARPVGGGGKNIDRVHEIRGEKYRNPLDKMASEYYSNAVRLACELGITPASASKVKEKPREEKRRF
ncbi:MAG: hypothetical protein ACLTZT_00155 [Butyricimonas faecalis]